MAPGVPASGFKNFSSRQVFEKKGIEITINSFFDHF